MGSIAPRTIRARQPEGHAAELFVCTVNGERWLDVQGAAVRLTEAARRQLVEALGGRLVA
jgi:hypothetical protein